MGSGSVLVSHYGSRTDLGQRGGDHRYGKGAAHLTSGTVTLSESHTPLPSVEISGSDPGGRRTVLTVGVLTLIAGRSLGPGM